MPIIELVQKIHYVAHRLRQSGEHDDEADVLDDTANQIVDLLTRELSTRERETYENERRYGRPEESTSSLGWKDISEL